jgi:hypothetical protein
VKLEKWQRNAIFEAVVAGGLSTLECALDDDDAGARVTHGPSQSYFRLEGDASRYTTTTVVGEAPPSWPLEAFTWDRVRECVQRWAREVKDDVNTPDLWAEVTRQRQILTGARYENVQNTPFTPDERAEIAKQIQQLKELVKRTSSLSEAQMRSLATKLDDLVTASGYVGRKDWQLMVFGVVFGMIANDFVSPEVVRGIFTMAIHSLDCIFGGGSLPPQLPSVT